MGKRTFWMLCATWLAGSLAFGDTYTDGNGLVWTYTTSSGKATLSGVAREDGAELTGTLAIPSSVNGATVETIAANAFQDMVVSKITFPEGLKTIHHGAFANCTSLEALALPDSLTEITGGNNGDGAFAGCSSSATKAEKRPFRSGCGSSRSGGGKAPSPPGVLEVWKLARRLPRQPPRLPR